MTTAFFAVLLSLLLLWSAISPRSLWHALASWRYRNPEANEPSDAAYTLGRIASAVVLAALACGGLFVLLGPDSGSVSPAEAPATFTLDPLVHPTALRAAFDADQGDLVRVPQQVTPPKDDHPVHVLHRQAVDDTATPDWLPGGGKYLTADTRLVVSVDFAASPSALVVREDADRVEVTVYTGCANCPATAPASPEPGSVVHVYLIPVSLRAPLGTRQVIDGSTGAAVA